jgi:hypothetical protein
MVGVTYPALSLWLPITAASNGKHLPSSIVPRHIKSPRWGNEDGIKYGDDDDDDEDGNGGESSPRRLLLPILLLLPPSFPFTLLSWLPPFESLLSLSRSILLVGADAGDDTVNPINDDDDDGVNNAATDNAGEFGGTDK